MPASNSPTPAATIRTAQSAWKREPHCLKMNVLIFCKGHSIYRLVGFFSPSINMPLILVKYLRRPSDHVLDEVSVSWSIYYCYVVLGGLKLPEWDVYGNSSLPLGLQLIQNPGILKGTFSHLPKQTYVNIQGVKMPSLRKKLSCVDIKAIVFKDYDSTYVIWAKSTLTVSHRSEYTPYIFVDILLYLYIITLKKLHFATM